MNFIITESIPHESQEAVLILYTVEHIYLEHGCLEITVSSKKKLCPAEILLCITIKNTEKSKIRDQQFKNKYQTPDFQQVGLGQCMDIVPMVNG